MLNTDKSNGYRNSVPEGMKDGSIFVTKVNDSLFVKFFKTPKQFLAISAIYIYVGNQFILEVGTRVQSIFGAETINSPIITSFSRIPPYAIGLICLLSLFQHFLRQSAKIPLKGALLGFAASIVLSAFVSLQFSNQISRGGLVTIFMVLAVIANFSKLSDLLIHLRFLTRLIASTCLFSAVFMPSYAFFTYQRYFFDTPRLMGVFHHPNALGWFAVCFFIIEISIAGKYRYFWSAIFLICLLLSQSRGILVALLVGLILQLTASKRKLIFALGLAWASAVFLVLFSSRLESLFASISSQPQYTSLSGRTPIWSITMNQFFDSPLFGYGPNFFNTDYREIFLASSMQQASNAHNEYLQVLGSRGIIGFIFFLILLLALARHAPSVASGSRWNALPLLGTFLVASVTAVTISTIGLPALPFIAMCSLIGVSSKELSIFKQKLNEH